MNGKRERIKSKVTNIDRAKLRAAKRAKTRKALNAETERRMSEAVPAFLQIEADEIERYTPPFEGPIHGLYDQPKDYGPPSGLLIHRKYIERDYVPRDKPRLGIMLCLLSAVCVLAVAVKLTGAA